MLLYLCGILETYIILHVKYTSVNKYNKGRENMNIEYKEKQINLVMSI